MPGDRRRPRARRCWCWRTWRCRPRGWRGCAPPSRRARRSASGASPPTSCDSAGAPRGGRCARCWGRRWGAGRKKVGFRYGAHGKPQLAGSPLHFNISHSGDLALIALAHVELGVDVELPRPRRTDAIARRFYAPGEVERLFAIEDAAARADAFFRLWTCKEAFLKVTGEGLSRSTQSYEIAPDRSRLLWATGIPDADARYSYIRSRLAIPTARPWWQRDMSGCAAIGRWIRWTGSSSPARVSSGSPPPSS